MNDSAAPVGRWIALAIAVLAADQLAKAAILATFVPGQELPLLPFFSLVLAFNRGAAFSFLAGASGWQRWFFAGVAIVASVFLVWMLRRGGSRALSTGVALILGGALGNLWDRLTQGRVTDFVLLHYQGWSWPAFNVADSAITVGAVLLLLDAFRERRA